MSFVFTAPDMVSTAAQDLAAIHSTLGQATSAAAAPTTALVAAAEDQVSSSVAALFGAFGQEYQVISAQAQTFHEQFVNLLNSGTTAYLSTEVANAEQAAESAISSPVQALLGQPLSGTSLSSAATSSVNTLSEIAGPYETLVSNTSTNLHAIATGWANSGSPALLKALVTGTGYPQQLLTALETGNVSSAMSIAQHLGQGYVNLAEELTVPVSFSVTALSPSSATLAVGLGLPQLLALDALGAPVNAATAFAASNSAILSALAAGNPMAAGVALIDAPANIANAFLNGQEALSVQIPLAGLSLTAPVPFSGLLVPLQPFSVTTTTVSGSPLLENITVTGPPIGGLIPGLLEYAPELLETALSG